MKKSKKLKTHNKRSIYTDRRKNMESEKVGNGVHVIHKVISKRDKLSDNNVQKILKNSDVSTEYFEQYGRGGHLTIIIDLLKCAGYCSADFLFDDVARFLPEALPKVQDVINNYNPDKEYVNVLLLKKAMAIMVIVVEKRFYSELTRM